MRLRKSKTDSWVKYQCSNCLMIFSRGSISSHKFKCQKGYVSWGKGFFKLSGNTFENKDVSFIDPEFYEEVFDKMYEDEIKKDFCTDIELTYIGNMCFQKVKLTRTNKNNPSIRARKLIRILGRLKQKVNKNNIQNKLTFSQMFSLKHWSLVHACIKNWCTIKLKAKIY